VYGADLGKAYKAVLRDSRKQGAKIHWVDRRKNNVGVKADYQGYEVVDTVKKNPIDSGKWDYTFVDNDSTDCPKEYRA
jgi:hypothetical protein